MPNNDLLAVLALDTVQESKFKLVEVTLRTPSHPPQSNPPVIPLPIRVPRLRRHLLMDVPTATGVLLQIHRILRDNRLALQRILRRREGGDGDKRTIGVRKCVVMIAEGIRGMSQEVCCSS